ncbi:protein SOSEKI 5 isoform X2 [Lotus japonicus]|uniref:protein SOSEKI 5 isoform X2 n=1 Tax=Lotus japonicus TaxID=34305 RepID=UPI00258BB1DA|nr:protein SOSEKI 5 isoform X2 [Lotus japonicus]
MSVSSSSSSRGRRITTTTDRETSPERTRVWTEPKPKTTRRVSVVYYLSRNGQLEHPHFMEVSLSSPHGLHLKDVIDRLNQLRGKGMATMYSWSAKRSYKNGFVWHDLSENDFIYPTQGQDYILKGSEILEHAGGGAGVAPHTSPQTQKSEEESDFPAAITRRRNQSWGSMDLNEYRVYKSDSFGDSAGRVAEAATQTEDKRRRRRAVREEKQEEEEKDGIGSEEAEIEGERVPHQSTELSREEISPPPSDSSPETLGTLMMADGRLGLRPPVVPVKENTPTAENGGSGRMRASSVLLQLLSCGAVSFKESGAGAGKDQGFSLVGHYKSRLPRGAGNHGGKEVGTLMEIPDLSRVRLEDKEYFSGSLIETQKVETPSLKSGSRLQMIEHEGEVVRAKCIPRKSKTLTTKKEEGTSMDIVSRSQHGSKRFDG